MGFYFCVSCRVCSTDIIMPQVQALPLMLLVHNGDGRVELFVTRHPLFRPVLLIQILNYVLTELDRYTNYGNGNLCIHSFLALRQEPKERWCPEIATSLGEIATPMVNSHTLRVNSHTIGEIATPFLFLHPRVWKWCGNSVGMVWEWCGDGVGMV